MQQIDQFKEIIVVQHQEAKISILIEVKKQIDMQEVEKEKL